jgi:multicomponent Na+:H+ antiporter subunit E
MSITTRRWLVAGALFGVLWVFVQGAAATPKGLFGSFVVGLAVGMPVAYIEPQVILIPLRVETDFGITTIANSITITPGTITMDHDPDENALYVHAIDGRDVDAIVDPIRDWEDYALRIFDERLEPGDEAPEIRVHPPDYPPEPKNAADPMEHLANRGEETEVEGTDDG